MTSTTLADIMLDSLLEQSIKHETQANFFEEEAKKITVICCDAAVEALKEVGMIGNPQMLEYAKKEAFKEIKDTTVALFGLARIATTQVEQIQYKVGGVRQQQDFHQAVMTELNNSFN